MLISGLAAYAAIKFWLPLVSALALMGKLFLIIRKGLKNAQHEISTWANTLLDNHMTHIQAAAERAADSIETMADANGKLAVSIQAMRDDFKTSQVEGIRVQNSILTGIEVIKAKVD